MIKLLAIGYFVVGFIILFTFSKPQTVNIDEYAHFCDQCFKEGINMLSVEDVERDRTDEEFMPYMRIKTCSKCGMRSVWFLDKAPGAFQGYTNSR